MTVFTPVRPKDPQPFKYWKPDGVLAFRLHEGQRAVLASKKMYTLALAGTGGGKTCIAGLWMRDRIAERGAGAYLMISATYDLFDQKLLEDLQDYFEHDLKIGRYWAHKQTFEIAEDLKPGNFKANKATDRMWAKVVIRSGSSETGLESAHVKAVVVDEADKPEITRAGWEAIQRRRNLNRGRVLFITTLYHVGWLKHVFYDPWKRGERQDIDVFQWPSLMNPLFSKEEYETAKKTMPAWKFRMQYEGQYDKPAGLIYDKFDQETQVLPRMTLDKSWPWVVGHDFGGANPAALFYAVDPSGQFWLHHVYLPGGGSSPYEHVQAWREICEGYNVVKRVGGNHAEEEIRAAYRAEGWPIMGPNPDVRPVEVGILRVYAYDAQKRIFVFDDLDDYLREKTSYSRKLTSDYKMTGDIENKSSFHLMDCERSIIASYPSETAVSQTSKKRPSKNYYGHRDSRTLGVRARHGETIRA